MRVTGLYKAIIGYFTNKGNFIHVSFYLLATGIIWYLYNFTVLIVLIMLLAAIASLSSFLLGVYFWVKGNFKGISKNIIYSLLFLIFLFPFILHYGVLSYTLALSAIITCLGIYRS